MYMLVVRCGQLHGAAHARTGELRGLASWQASRDWRQPAGGRFGYLAENSPDVPNPCPYALSAVLWKQDQLG
jgi:hypothetical protein